MSLQPEQHPTRDFFIADIFDNTPFKDDMASMEHPIFVLSKKKDVRCLEYKKENISISIKPTIDGLPTIFDKDILLYCASLLMQEINAGHIPPKTLRISSHDLLVATNRQTDGKAYKLLKKALQRLAGVRIQTNIKTNRREQTKDFGLLESWETIESSHVKDRMIKLEITLSDWFYNSIVSKEVLTINRDYFRLGKPMERRLYEIARKHCGAQKEWSINLTRLMDKTGAKSTLRLFRSRLKDIAKDNHLPDYNIFVNNNDNVTFSQKRDVSKQEMLPLDDLPHISSKTIERARQIVTNAETGWDFNTLHTEFTQSLIGGFRPDKVNGAFINFVKKKIISAP
ncbi:MAG: replication initiator protein A [Alphaproteobacteria bacterium]|nr:replication initiator protein A [Alphaproteobacteria bacterium]MCK5658885.1 replication initiator protein A [Alphaproteobacteria bacterium]